MALPNTFAAQSVAQMSELDTNFTTVGRLGIIPCNATGTNQVVITPGPGLSPDITSYNNYIQVSFVAANTSTGSLFVGVTGLQSIPVFAPNGVAGGSGTFIQNQLYQLAYLSLLNGGNGGWLIMNAGTATAGVSSLAASSNGGLSVTAATGAVSSLINPANTSAKTTPAMADLLMIGDSAAGFALKNTPIGSVVRQQCTVICDTGHTLAGAAWQTGVLDAVLYDPFSLVTSIASNNLVLVAGTYMVQGWVSFAPLTGATITCQGRIRDTTNSSTLLAGSVIQVTTGNQNNSLLQGPLTSTGQNIQIQQWIDQNINYLNGGGTASGEAAILSSLTLVKIG